MHSHEDHEEHSHQEEGHHDHESELNQIMKYAVWKMLVIIGVVFLFWLFDIVFSHDHEEEENLEDELNKIEDEDRRQEQNFKQDKQYNNQMKSKDSIPKRFAKYIKSK